MVASPTTEPTLTLTITDVELPPSSTGAVFYLTAQTSLPAYLESQYSLSRTSIEVERLYTYLCKCFPDHIPPAPPPSRTDSGLAEEQVLKGRAQYFLDRVASHSIFRVSEGVRAFVESDFEFVPPSAPSKKQGGILRAFGSYPPSVKEIDVFFEQAKVATAASELGTASVEKAVERAGRVERDAGKAASEVGSQLITLSLCDNKAMVRALRTVGKGLLATEKLQTEQATFLAGRFNDDCKSLVRETQSVQAALNYRLEALQDYDGACKTTQKKLQAIDRLRSSSRIQQDKVDGALEDLQEAKEVESESRSQFRHISDMMKVEFVDYTTSQERVMSEIMDHYARKQLDYTRRRLELWESISAELG